MTLTVAVKILHNDVIQEILYLIEQHNLLALNELFAQIEEQNEQVMYQDTVNTAAFFQMVATVEEDFGSSYLQGLKLIDVLSLFNDLRDPIYSLILTIDDVETLCFGANDVTFDYIWEYIDENHTVFFIAREAKSALSRENK